MRRALLVLLLISLALPVVAVNYGTVRQAANDRLDVIWPDIKSAANACVRSRSDCYTNWSCSSPCNNKNADASVCMNTQVDLGNPSASMNADGSTCAVTRDNHTFANFGWSPAATEVFCIKLNTYEGPGTDPENQGSKRGVIASIRIQHGNTIYERRKASGPQKDTLAMDWAAVTP